MISFLYSTRNRTRPHTIPSASLLRVTWAIVRSRGPVRRSAGNERFRLMDGRCPNHWERTFPAKGLNDMLGLYLKKGNEQASISNARQLIIVFPPSFNRLFASFTLAPGTIGQDPSHRPPASERTGSLCCVGIAACRAWPLG